MFNNLTNSVDKLIFFGVGQAAFHVARMAESYSLFGTTRDERKIPLLKQERIQPLLIDSNLSLRSKILALLENACLLVSFPPDGPNDKLFSSLSSRCKTIIYISSTSVYGDRYGLIDENTEPDWKNEKSLNRLQAESYWLEKGAIVFRAAGLYGPESGLHLRLRDHSYNLPTESDNYVSRIHLDDLARLVLGAFKKKLAPKSIYLVADAKPAKQIDVVKWLCKEMSIPLPPISDDITNSRIPKSNRQIKAQKILDDLRMDLLYPDYKEGYKQCLEKSDFNVGDRE